MKFSEFEEMDKAVQEMAWNTLLERVKEDKEKVLRMIIARDEKASRGFNES